MVGGNRDGSDDETWDEGEAPIEPTQQLPLDDSGDRLPWLESADDDEDEPQYASDSGRLLLFALIGLLVMLAIVGGIWWAGRGDGAAQLANGSVIKAPSAPYKEAPKDPGGKTFDGTGDSSFAVSEGQSRPGRLGGETGAAPVATPSPAAVASTAPKPAASPAAPAQSAAPGGVGVQVGAYSSQAGAEAGWGRLVAAHGSILSGVSHRVIAGKADIGTVYRLQAVAGDGAAAQAMCGKLKAAGVSCQVK
jgi:hypothetical protein